MSETELYLPAAQVRQRYGGISDMTLWRWLNDPALDFPKPLRIKRRRYWKPCRLDAFDHAQAQKVREEDK